MTFRRLGARDRKLASRLLETMGRIFLSFLHDLPLVSERQRQGIGLGSIEKLEALASKAGIAGIFVFADDEDRHAVHFYRAHEMCQSSNPGQRVATTYFLVFSRMPLSLSRLDSKISFSAAQFPRPHGVLK